MAKRLFTSFVVFIMMLVMAIPVFASAYQQTITLPANQVWVQAGDIDRSGDFSYIRAKCHSVFPGSGLDLFYTIQCRLVNSSGTEVSNAYSLDERDSDYTNIYIKEGYLSTSPVYVQFRGNSNAKAYATVSYYGK